MKKFLVAAYLVVEAEDKDAADLKAITFANENNDSPFVYMAKGPRLYLDERIYTEEAPEEVPHCVLDWPQMGHPTECPNCGNDDGLYYDSGEFGPDNCHQAVTCPECGCQWGESYMPTGFEIWDNGDPAKKKKKEAK